jgi:hypothetical protein
MAFSKRIRKVAILVVAIIFILPWSTAAGIILQDQSTGAPTFVVQGPNSTFAQSFTAEDSRISSIGFALADANPSLGALQFTVILFAGEGVSGPVLSSVTRTFTSIPPLDPSQPMFFDFDFSTVVLTPGQVYTAKIVSFSGRGQTYESYFLGDVYPGGLAYHNDVPFLAPTGNGSEVGPEDMVFRVLPASQPVILSLTASPSVLWPPNHKMVPVTVVASASDGTPVAPVCQITGVTSNEFSTTPGEVDIAITGSLTLVLRAERAGSGGGRVYAITAKCTNASQLSDTKEVNVRVPHDQGR